VFSAIFYQLKSHSPIRPAFPLWPDTFAAANHFLLMRFVSLLLLLLSYAGAFAQRITERDFQAYFDEYNLRGSFLLLDAGTQEYTAYNLKRCRQGFLPASTFKIPNTIIGLETGELRDTSDICRWDGRLRSFPAWNEDMPWARALRVSSVPCYQQLARRIGAARYQKILPKLKFGRMVVTAATVDSFWLTGLSRITQFEQIGFLRRLQRQQLPVAARSQDITKALLVLARGPGWTLRGKTGWSQEQGQNNGWFVGWVEERGHTYFFALNVETPIVEPTPASFVQGRRALTEKILRREFHLIP
jgi:beta-lactamase class D